MGQGAYFRAVALATVGFLAAGPARAQDAWLRAALDALTAEAPTNPRDAAEVVRAQVQARRPIPASGLPGFAPLDVRHAAWRLAGRADAGSLTALFGLAGDDGGFGAGPGHAASAVDTAEVLLSAGELGFAAPLEVEAALVALLRLQRADGGFASNGLQSDLPTTCLAVRALAEFRALLPSPLPLDAATFWLRSAPIDAQPVLYTALRADALSAALALTEADVADLRAARGADGRYFDLQGTAAATRAWVGAAADLEFESATLSAADVAAGATVRVTVVVRNGGLTTAPASALELQVGEGDDAPPARSQALPSLEASESAELVFEVETAGRRGGLTLKLDLDPSDAVWEADEGDNERGLRLRVREPAPADLEIRPDLIALEPALVPENTPFRARLRVRNRGDVDAPATRATLHLGAPEAGGRLLADVAVPAVQAHAEVEVTANLAPLPSQAGRLVVVVDPDARIADAHRLNNRAVRALSVVGGANLAVLSGAVVLEPGPVVGTGTPVTVRARVSNSGTALAARTTVALEEAGGPTLARMALPALEPGAVAEVVAHFTPDEPGLRALLLRADADEALTEGDEVDNYAALVLEVADHDLHIAPGDPEAQALVVLPSASLDFNVSVYNRGQLPVGVMAVAARAGSPDGPIQARGTCGPFSAAPRGGAVLRSCGLTALAEGLPPGPLRLYYCVDPDDILKERDEGNNCTFSNYVIEPHRDVSVTLTFDPAEPEPGSFVEVTYTTRAAQQSQYSRLRIRADQQTLLAEYVPLNASGTIRWRAPDQRGIVHFEATADAGIDVGEVRPADNRFEWPLPVGGPPAVVGALALGAAGERPAVAGRPARLRVSVDAATDVSFGALRRPATPQAPAEFPLSAPAPGEQVVSLTTPGRPEPAQWPVEIRRAGPTAGLAATVVPEGISLGWDTLVGATGFLALRDGEPIGSPTRLPLPLLGLPEFLTPDTRYEVTLGRAEFIGALAMDLSRIHDSVVVHWQVDALDLETGRWRTIHEEGGGQVAEPPVRRIEPVLARHLRLTVKGALAGRFSASMALHGFEPTPGFTALDDGVGVAAGDYTVLARHGDVLGEASSPVSAVHILEAPTVRTQVSGAELRIEVDALPGRRVAGFVVEVDGLPLPDAPLPISDVYPRALTRSGLPLDLRLSWTPGLTVARDVVALFEPPRLISSVPSISNDPRWQSGRADDGPFAPGLYGQAELYRPGADDDVNLLFTPEFLGPPMVPPEGGILTLQLPAGDRVLSVTALDRAGRGGASTLVSVTTEGPGALADVAAVMLGDEVRLSWRAPPEAHRVHFETQWGQSGDAAADAGEVLTRPLDLVGRIYGHVTYRLTPYDVADNAGPATTVSVDVFHDVPTPEDLAVEVQGFRVMATWEMPRMGEAIAFYVSVDGQAPVLTQDTRVELLAPQPGAHVLIVHAVRAGGHHGPAARAPFAIDDDGPPISDVSTPSETWRWNTQGLAYSWNQPAESDVVEVLTTINAEAPTVRPGREGSHGVPWRPGIDAYRVAFQTRDGAGHTSPVTEHTFLPPASFSAAGFAVGALRGEGSIPFTPPTDAYWGHFVYRDGQRICDWASVGLHVRTISGGAPFGQSGPFGASGSDGNPWVTDAFEDQPTVVLRVGGGPDGLPIDRLSVDFATVSGTARAFHVDARAQGADWREVWRVEDNVEGSLEIDLPDTPRVGAEQLRLVIDEHIPETSVQLRRFQAFTCSPPASDRPLVGGRFAYSARTWGPSFSPGPPSVAQTVDVPVTDLVLPQSSLRLSDDEALVGDTVAVIIPVTNDGPSAVRDVTVALSVARSDCARDAVESGRTALDLAAGQTSAVVLPWRVAGSDGLLCARVDPDDSIAERVENNNATLRGVAADLPWRTETYANGVALVVACNESVHYILRPANGGAPLMGDLLPGSAAWLDATGAISVSADAPFALQVGAPIDATALVLRDCEGNLRTRDVTGDVPQNRPLDPLMAQRSPGLVVFAPDAPTHVIASEPFRWSGRQTVASGALLFEADVPTGVLRFLNPHQRPDGRATESIRLESDADLIAWSYADIGFTFVGADGLQTGSDLRGFAGKSSSQFQRNAVRGEEIVIVSHDADNRVELVREDTGAVVLQGLLPAYGIVSHYLLADENPGFIPLRVRASGRVTVFNMSLLAQVANGYAHSFFVPGESGRLFDRRFVVPLTTNGREDDFAPVIALYDGTTVVVTAPDTGDVVYQGTLSRGQAVDLLNDTAVTDNPLRRRLVVEANRPVSIYEGVGTAGAEMAPMMFAPENRADLLVAGVFTVPDLPLPGDVVEVQAEVRNEGVLRARRALVRVYDGPVAEGRLLHEQVFERLDAGQPGPIRFALGVSEGERVLTFVVDPEDAVPETREDNNLTTFAVANPPDLVALAPSGDLRVGVAGVLNLPIRNEGGQPVLGARVSVFADDVLLGSVGVDVPAAGLATATMSWRPERAGPVVIRAEVAVPDDVEEARADNNRAAAELVVLPADRDLEGEWSATPNPAGPLDEVVLEVRLNEPVVSAVEARLDGQRIAGGLTGSDGRARLLWRGEKSVGTHRLLVAVDADDAVAETDEDNNVSELVVELAPYAVALDVEGPATPVGPGNAVELMVTPTAALPVGAVLTAPGFAPTLANGEASVRLSGLAPESAGEARVSVVATLQGQAVAQGTGRFQVAAAGETLELHLWPVSAGVGEPVTLEARVTGAGVVVFRVNGDDVSRADAPGERSVIRALSVDSEIGAHDVTVRLVSPGNDGDVLASATGAFERQARPPFTQLGVTLDDQVAAAGSTLDVEITLLNPEPETPMQVDSVFLAVADEPPTRVYREARLDVHRRLGAPQSVRVVVGPLPWTSGTYRLIARGEAGGRMLGVGTAGLLVFDTDATPPPDLGVPDAAEGDPRTDASRLDSGGDERADGGGPLLPDLGEPPLLDLDGTANATDGPTDGDSASDGVFADGRTGDDARSKVDGPSLDAADPTDARPAKDAGSAGAGAPKDAGQAGHGRDPEAGAEGAAEMATGGGTPDSGCDCRASPRGPGTPLAIVVLLAAARVRRRRR